MLMQMLLQPVDPLGGLAKLMGIVQSQEHSQRAQALQEHQLNTLYPESVRQFDVREQRMAQQYQDAQQFRDKSFEADQLHRGQMMEQTKKRNDLFEASQKSSFEARQQSQTMQNIAKMLTLADAYTQINDLQNAAKFRDQAAGLSGVPIVDYAPMRQRSQELFAKMQTGQATQEEHLEYQNIQQRLPQQPTFNPLR